jgi:hypothetical protein
MLVVLTRSRACGLHRGAITDLSFSLSLAQSLWVRVPLLAATNEQQQQTAGKTSTTYRRCSWGAAAMSYLGLDGRMVAPTPLVRLWRSSITAATGSSLPQLAMTAVLLPAGSAPHCWQC